MIHAIQIRRVYDAPGDDDGRRFLVDRLWPRGVSRGGARVEAWLRDVAPSDDLRRWYDHDPERWDELLRRYHAELDGDPDGLVTLLDAVREGPVTLVYAARDTERNNAVALRRYLLKRLRRG